MEKRQLNLPTLVQNQHLALWILLLLLTAIILLFPFQLHYEYYPIESAHVFGSRLPLFAVLYYTWFGVLLLLLFFNGKSNEWQKLALVCLFSLVFFGVWIINMPNGSHCDVVRWLGHVNYIQETGRIVTDNPNLGYFESPAFFLLNSPLSQICGLGVFETRPLYLLFGSVLLAALLYLLFMKLLGNPYLASLAVLLMLLGSRVARTQVFSAGNLAFLFLVLLLLLLARRKEALRTTTPMVSAPIVLAMIIFFIAFAMSYTPTPIYFIFILLGIYLLQRVAKRGVIDSPTVALFVVIFLSWEIYWAYRFAYLAGLIPYFVEGFTDPLGSLFWVSRGGEAYLGGATPLWASLTRFSWLALIFGLGGILAIWNLVKANKLDSKGVLVTGGLVGAAVFAIICIFTFTWEGQWGRFAQIAPLFTIPIILKFLSGFSLSSWFRRHIFILLIILVFVLSLPSFLIQRPGLCTDAVRPYDRSAVEFSASAYGADELDLFSTLTTVIMYEAHHPQAHLHSSREPWATDKEELWQEMNNLMDDFEDSKGRKTIFVLSEQFKLPPQHPAAIQSDDPRWVEYVNTLEKNDKIYNNGHIQIYQHLAE